MRQSRSGFLLLGLGLWLAVAVASLSSCADAPRRDPSPSAPAAQTEAVVAERPAFIGDSFLTTDGLRLPLRRWLPPGRPKAVILALHGFNDYSHAFAMPAKIWAEAGIATYAYDQRGFGGAPGRGRWPGRAALATDVAAACDVLRRLYPEVPLYLLGESMGAAVAIVAMTGEAGTPIPNIDGLILVSPAAWGRATMGLLPRVALFVGVRLFPNLKLTGQSLHILASDNIPMLRALARDPMVIKRTRVDAIWGLVNLMDAALEAAPRLRGRVLVMYGGHDEVIPKPPVRRFVRALRRDPRDHPRIAYYPHGYHMLLRDLDGPTISADIAGWVRMPGAPLASGADRGGLAAARAVTSEALLSGR